MFLFFLILEKHLRLLENKVCIFFSFPSSFSPPFNFLIYNSTVKTILPSRLFLSMQTKNCYYSFFSYFLLLSFFLFKDFFFPFSQFNSLKLKKMWLIFTFLFQIFFFCFRRRIKNKLKLKKSYFPGIKKIKILGF